MYCGSDGGGTIIMLTLKVNGETYKGVNYSALIEVIQNNVSYDIINDEIEYTENVVREDNGGVMDDDLYDEYVGALEDEQYKEIVINHLKKIKATYKITGKSDY